MTRELKNFYTGFEGEAEIQIVEKDSHGTEFLLLRMWAGYFDSIIYEIPPNSNGMWEGVPLYFHTQTGWYENDNWECKDKVLFLTQLQSVDENKLDFETNQTLKCLKEVIASSIKSDNRVYFFYA